MRRSFANRFRRASRTADRKTLYLCLPRGLSAAEKTAWNAAIDSYAKGFGTRKELFDDRMVNINNAVAQLSDEGGSLNSANVPPTIAAVLQSAAPIYRKYWWPTHDAANQNWISSQTARVKQIGPQIAAAMEKDLRQEWPGDGNSRRRVLLRTRDWIRIHDHRSGACDVFEQRAVAPGPQRI